MIAHDTYSENLRARIGSLLARGVSMRRICEAAGGAKADRVASWLRGEAELSDPRAGISLGTADRLLAACIHLDAERGD